MSHEKPTKHEHDSHGKHEHDAHCGHGEHHSKKHEAKKGDPSERAPEKKIGDEAKPKAE